MGSSNPPIFDDLLSRLQQVHEQEVQELRKEIDGLRADLVQRNGGGGAAEEWRTGRLDGDRQAASAISGECSNHRDDSGSDAQSPVVAVDLEPIKAPVERSKKRSPVRFEATDGDCRDWDLSGMGAEYGSRPSTAAHAEFLHRTRRSTRMTALFQPRSINFSKMCSENFPGQTWDMLSHHEKVRLLRHELEAKHVLINPQSTAMKYWDAVLVASLTFTGLVTPYEVVFVHNVDWGLFGVNRVVDLIFLLDIVLQFFLQVEIQEPHRGGTIILRDPWLLRKRYLKTWFAVDVLSILPFDLLSLTMVDASTVWRHAKISRCLRLVRLAKLVRILRTWKIHNRWRDAIGMRFCTQRMIRFCTVIVLVSHWMACLWGLTGMTLGAEVCDSSGRRIDFGDSGPEVNDVSWVTTLYFGGKTSPDTPCNPMELYTASLHWAVMTLTSIGYGDIVPVRFEEYIVGILCMLVGGVLWAYVIGSLCSIISNVSPVERSYENNTDLLNLAMEEARIPREDRNMYRQYLREAKAHNRTVRFHAITENLSPMLRKSLLHYIMRQALSSVYFFNFPRTPTFPGTPTTFLEDISGHLVPKFFAPFEALGGVRQHLCLVDRGTVAHCGLILVHPSAFNEDFIVSNRRYQRVTRTICLAYTQLLLLSKPDLEKVLEHYPRVARKIWRCAFFTALGSAVRLIARAQQSRRAQSPTSPRLSLSEAFNRLGDRDREAVEPTPSFMIGNASPRSCGNESVDI